MDSHQYIRGIRSSILRLAWPAMLEMTLHTSLWMVDTAMVGRLGAAALSAVGLAGQVYWTVVWIAGSLSAGTVALVARACGAEDYKEASTTAGEALGLALVGGLGTFAVLRAVADLGSRLISMEPEVKALFGTYMQVMSYGAIAVVATIVGNSVMRSTGDTRTPLAIAALANAANALGDWALIFGNIGMPALGVRGAAIASVGSQLLGCGLVLIALLTPRTRTGVRLSWPRAWRPGHIKTLISLSIPAAAEVLLMDGSRAVQMLIMGSLGKTQFAAHQVAIACESLSFMPGYGFAIASSVLAGQSLGAGDLARARDCTMQCLAMGATTMGAVGLLFLLTPMQLVGLFSNEVAVIAPAAAALRLAGLVQPAIAASDTIFGAFRGSGDTRTPMLITALGAWAVRVPLTFISVRLLDLPIIAVWVVNAIEWSLKALIAWIWYNSGRWVESPRIRT